MTTATQAQAAREEMFAVDPAEAWSESLADHIAMQYQWGRDYNPLADEVVQRLVGDDAEVHIPNGLTGNDAVTRVCVIVITQDMIDRAIALADQMLASK
jgi:hypothetical protein